MRAILIALIVFIGCGVAPGRLAAQQVPRPEVEAEVVTAPVEIDGAVLFQVRGVSSIPAAERASVISQRFKEIAADPAIAADALHVEDGDGVSRILAGTRLLMSVVDADAKLEQVERPGLARAHVYRFQQALESYRAARSAAAVRGGALRALLSTVVLIGVLLLAGWFGRRVDRAAEARLRGRLKKVEAKSLEVLRAERIWDAVHGALVAIRALVTLAIVLGYLNYVLAQFPWTRSFAGQMSAYVLDPIRTMGWGVLRSIPSLVFLTVLFIVVRVLLRVVRLYFGAIERRSVRLHRFDPEWAQPTYKIVRVAIIAFGFIVAYPYIPGSGSAAFQGVSVFVGVMFSLGSSSVISNIIAGYAMIYRRAFKVGDRIRIGNAVGDVIETRLQVTHLRSVKNEEIIIPNMQILSQEVMNYSSLGKQRSLILHTEVGIGYDTPWRQVEAMLLQAAERTKDVLGAEPRPFILIKKLGDFAVVYELNVPCIEVQTMGRQYTALHRNILDVFNEHGVQIMTPAYENDPETRKVAPPGAWTPPDAAEPASAEPDLSPS